MNIQLYTLPESWSPPEWTKCDYNLPTEKELEDKHEEIKKLDPKRFERLIPKNYNLFNGGCLLRSIIPLASVILSATTLTTGSCYFFGMSRRHLKPLFYLSMALSCLVERVSHYFFSPRPTKENLQEAILEATRNPIMQKLLNQTSEGHEIEINLVDRSHFEEKSKSMAYHYLDKDLRTGGNKSIIEIWDGNRSFKSFLFDRFETADYYYSNTNPILWNANPLTMVIFEMINACQRNKFEALIALARRGEINRKEYVVLKEFVESGTVNLFCKVVQYGIEYMGWDPNWFHIKRVDMHLKNLENDEVHFFKENVWPSDIFEAPGKISHARYYSDQWYNLCLSNFFSVHEKFLSSESLKNISIDDLKNILKAACPDLNLDEATEVEDCCVDFSLALSNGSLKPLFAFMKTKNEPSQEEKQNLEPTLGESRQFFKELLKRRKAFKDFYIELKKDVSKITENNFQSLSHSFEGKCLLQVLEDALFEEQDLNQRVDLDFLRAFLKKNEPENLKYHPKWLFN